MESILTSHLQISSHQTGFWDLIRYLLLCIFHMQVVIDKQRQELMEKEVVIQKLKEGFASKNEQTPLFKSTQVKKKRGAPRRPPRKVTKAKVRKKPQNLEKKEIELDFEEVPRCVKCNAPYIKTPSLSKISHQIAVGFRSIHEVLKRLSYKQSCSCQRVKKIVTAPDR